MALIIINDESIPNKLDTRKLRSKLGLDTPLCLAINLGNSFNKITRQGTTSNCLKLKGLGGTLHLSRGAC